MQGSEPAAEAQRRVTRLRHDLLGGRGPGATTAEVARRTRDRGNLGGVRTCVELEIVHNQNQRSRGGGQGLVQPGGPAAATAFKPVLLGAVGALVIRSILSSWVRARRGRNTRDELSPADPSRSERHSQTELGKWRLR